MNSDLAYEEFCDFFTVDCLEWFTKLKFQRKARNCLTRHTADDDLYEVFTLPGSDFQYIQNGTK